MLRFRFDLVATFLHLLTLLIALTTGSFLVSFSGACLALMEFIALVFHVGYVICFRGKLGVPRGIKWFEYGISATLGTIAVLHINAEIHWDWGILFILIGNAQQLIGLLVDVDWELGPRLWQVFIAGCLIQVGEFIFVAIHAGVGAVYWIYFGFYGLFGVHALVGFTRCARERGDYMEEIYALYGFLAKLAVFYAEYFANAAVQAWKIGVVGACIYVATVIYTLVFFVRSSRANS